MSLDPSSTTVSTDRRPRTGWRATFVLALSGALAACGPPAAANPPAQVGGSAPAPTAVAPDSASSPAPVAVAPGPPPPVPATFDVAALAERVKPLVVNITTTRDVDTPVGADPFEFFFGPQGRRNPERPQRQVGAGTGFVIDRAGYVVTNEHVVHDADTVRVKFADDRELAADVVGRDPKLDLALLKIAAAGDIPAAALGSSEQLRVGEHVLAVGNPFGLGHTVTLGIVSAKARTIGAGPYDDFIQTDASINPGNSGGPLFNWKGEVVGINTAIRANANGIGFAIPIDALKDVLAQLRDKGRVERGKLGLVFQPMTPDLARAIGLDAPRGALVTDLEPGGPAQKAGIKSGDVVLAVNGVTIQHSEELPRNVARNPPGSIVRVSLLRTGKKIDVSAKLDPLGDDDPGRSQRPPHAKPQSAGKLGLTVSDAPGGGARVDAVTGADVREIDEGDVIVEMNGTPVTTSRDLAAVAEKLKPGSTTLVKVRRGRVTRFAAMPIPK